ncbi:hypothetical protein BH11BAC4_BH11BAC4_26590 [soil metagenome]
MFIRLKRKIAPAMALVLVCSSCTKDDATSSPNITPAGSGSTVVVSTIAGKLHDHGNAEDGNAANARFWNPGKMIYDNRNHTLYVADGTTIRSVDALNNVNTYMPLGTIGGFNEILDLDLAPGVAGSLYFTTKENDLVKIEPDGNTIRKTILINRVTGGNETGAMNASDQLDGANGIATGPNGDINMLNAYWNCMHRIQLSSPVTGTVTSFAGKPTATRSGIAWPYMNGQGEAASMGGSIPDIAADANGNIYVADFRNDLERMVTADGTVSSLFKYMDGFGIDQDGPVAVAQANRVTQVATSSDGTQVFFSTYGKGNNTLPALRLLKKGISVTTLVGNSNNYADGSGDLAGLGTIGGIAATPDGKTLYVSEPGNKVIGKIVIGH